MLKELTDDNFQQKVTNSQGVVLVDFYAEWCGPCKILASTVEELSDEFSGKADIYKADIETNASAVKELDITGVPAIVLFKEGKVVNKHIGLRSKKDLQKDIEEACNG